MKACHCSLGGTAACLNCPHNRYRPIPYYKPPDYEPGELAKMLERMKDLPKEYAPPDINERLAAIEKRLAMLEKKEGER